MAEAPGVAPYRPCFEDDAGQPRLWPCAVLFLDLLGVAGASSTDEDLRRFHAAVRRTFGLFLEPRSPWPVAIFSDLIVLAAPLEMPWNADDPAEEEPIGGLVSQAAFLQTNLLAQGFASRGAITVGPLHLLDGIVFGPALVTAYEIERRRAAFPRVVVDTAVEPFLQRALEYYADPRLAPQSSMLLRDADGELIVDYLSVLFDDPDEADAGIEMHRVLVTDRLGGRQAPRVWEKYRWMADYHDAVCERRQDLLAAPAAARIDTSVVRRRFQTLT